MRLPSRVARERPFLAVETVLALLVVASAVLTMWAAVAEPWWVESSRLVLMFVLAELLLPAVLLVEAVVVGTRLVRSGLPDDWSFLVAIVRALELLLAGLLAGTVALGLWLGRLVSQNPDPHGGGIFIGLFLVLVLTGLALSVVVLARSAGRLLVGDATPPREERAGT